MNNEFPDNHGKFWTKEDIAQLKEFFAKDYDVDKIAEQLKRKPNAIIGQLERLNLVVNIKGFVYKIDTNLYYNNRRN